MVPPAKKKVQRKGTGRKTTGQAARRSSSGSARKTKSSSSGTTRKRSKSSSVSATKSKRSGTRASKSPAVAAVNAAGTIRLNKYLADHGVASRRKCDELISKGKVTVDGSPVIELGARVDPTNSKVEIAGFVLRPEKTQRRYYLLNKPSGVICTNEGRETRPRAVDMITDRDKGRIYTVGRLDEDSKGLILLTNDGDFANHIMHPSHGVPKTYSVRVLGRIEDEALRKVRHGVHLSEGRTAGARILIKRRMSRYSILSVTLQEGMNREIRRAFARVGYKVVDLKRTNIGPINDRGLKIGHWRPLKRAEVAALLHYAEDHAAGNPSGSASGNARRGASGNAPRGASGNARRGAGRRGKDQSREQHAQRRPGRAAKPQAESRPLRRKNASESGRKRKR